MSRDFISFCSVLVCKKDLGISIKLFGLGKKSPSSNPSLPPPCLSCSGPLAEASPPPTPPQHPLQELHWITLRLAHPRIASFWRSILRTVKFQMFPRCLRQCPYPSSHTRMFPPWFFETVFPNPQSELSLLRPQTFWQAHFVRPTLESVRLLVDHKGKVGQEKEFRLSVQSLLKQNFLVHRNSYVRTSVLLQSNGCPSYPFSFNFESFPKKISNDYQRIQKEYNALITVFVMWPQNCLKH